MSQLIGISITYTDAVRHMLAQEIMSAIEYGEVRILDKETYLEKLESIDPELADHPDWQEIEIDLFNQVSDSLADPDYLNSLTEYGGYREGLNVSLGWFNDTLYIQ